MRIAGAIKLLVVRESDGLGQLQQLRVRAAEDAGADERVLLHDAELMIREPAGLHEDRVRDADLADVVHRAGQLDELDIGLREAELAGEDRRVARHALEVRGGVLILVFRGDREPEDRVDVGVAHLLDEPGVGQRDRGLGGEGVDEVHLILEGPEADDLVVVAARVDELQDAEVAAEGVAQRHGEDRDRAVVVAGVEAAIEAVGHVLGQIVDVVDLDDGAARRRVAGDGALRDRDRDAAQVLFGEVLVERLVLRDAEGEPVALAGEEAAGLTVKEPSALLDDGREESIELVLPREHDADLGELSNAVEELLFTVHQGPCRIAA